MDQYTCNQCQKEFNNEAKYKRHMNKKKPCKSNSDLLISNINVNSKMNSKIKKENDDKKEKDNKKISELITNLSNIKINNNNTQIIYNEDCIEGMKKLENETADIIICDPPYNIGKNFGNNTTKQELKTYLSWCDKWIKECIRILKPTGTLYIYGYSEILAFIRVRIDINVRWIVWHYTNKVSPSHKFWQRTHESILCCYKKNPIFNRDDVREPYTEAFLKNAAGKVRKPTKGRFSDGTKETVYKAHESGALPRDVIKIPALAGGAGKKERVNHPTQKPLELCKRLIRASINKEGDTLLVVPFAGSGSECVAAAHEKIRCIGYEINKEYVDLCSNRLSNIQQK